MKRSFLAAVAFVFVAVSSASALTIPLGTTGWQAVWDNSLNPYVNITVDGTTTAETAYIHKTATFIQPPDEFGFFPTIPITFQQTGPSSLTRIVILDETLTNSTGVNWTDFHWDLIDHEDAAFDAGQSFATSPLGNQSWYNGNMSLSVEGGLVASGSVWTPGSGANGGELAIITSSKAQTPYTVFTLKETPTPEPASLLLIAIGTLLLRRRR
jgi:hypothetical protein